MIAMHPGEYIQDIYMDELGVTQTALAKQLGVSISTVSRLLAGSAELTPEMAVRCERVLGRSAESWLAMQSDYNLMMARQKVDTSGLHALAV